MAFFIFFFPKNPIPCHLPNLVDFPSAKIRICQSVMKQIGLVMWIWCVLSVSRATWFSSLYLYNKDLVVSMVSIGLGCFPSKMTWFLWNQMHQRVVRTKDNVSMLQYWAGWLKQRSEIHCCTEQFWSTRCLMLISIPNQIALAKLHCRNRWKMDSISELQRQQVVSHGIPLLASSDLTGMALCRIFQVKRSTLYGSLIFHMISQSFWFRVPWLEVEVLKWWLLCSNS